MSFFRSASNAIVVSDVVSHSLFKIFNMMRHRLIQILKILHSKYLLLIFWLDDIHSEKLSLTYTISFLVRLGLWALYHPDTLNGSGNIDLYMVNIDFCELILNNLSVIYEHLCMFC